jgi:hypothetical protein
MVNADYIPYPSQESLERADMAEQRSYEKEDKLGASTTVQPSYWKFLAQKLPLETEGGPIQEEEDIEQEEEEEEEKSDEFNALQSIDAVLHIVADNHKSHEAAQRRHSAPPSGYYLHSSVSAPALSSKSKNRWGQSNAESNVNLKAPSRFSGASSSGNATWSEQTPPSSSSSSRQPILFESLGLSNLRGNASVAKKKSRPYRRSHSLGSGDLTSSPEADASDGCRWSIPATSSDSLFVPRRVRES